MDDSTGRSQVHLAGLSGEKLKELCEEILNSLSPDDARILWDRFNRLENSLNALQQSLNQLRNVS